MHPGALAIRADVCDAVARVGTPDRLSQRFGKLNVLVNNAGTFVERDFQQRQIGADIDEEVALNLTAPIHLTSEVLERWPSLDATIFVTSGYALVSPDRAPTCGAVKAGLHGFAEGPRRNCPTNGTHVLELLPPLVDTPTNAKVAGKKMAPAEVAAVTLKALDKRRHLALRGQTKLLPTLLRIAPKSIGRRIGSTSASGRAKS